MNSSSTTLTIKHLIDNVGTKWSQTMLSNYSNRHSCKYHTTCHLEEMFVYQDLLLLHCPHNKPTNNNYKEKEEEEEVAIMTMAIFFHDDLYNGKSNTNKEDSVNVYQQFEEDVI